MLAVNLLRSLVRRPLSYVYFIGAAGFGGPVKIGIAGNPWDRLQRLQVGHPSTLAIHALAVGGRNEEVLLHRYFSATRVRGEWFHLDHGMAVLMKCLGACVHPVHEGGVECDSECRRPLIEALGEFVLAGVPQTGGADAARRLSRRL